MATTPCVYVASARRHVDGLVTGPAAAGLRRVTALDHEAGNDAVEHRVVVEPRLGEGDERRGSRRRRLGVERHDERAARRVERERPGLLRIEGLRRRRRSPVLASRRLDRRPQQPAVSPRCVATAAGDAGGTAAGVPVRRRRRRTPSDPTATTNPSIASSDRTPGQATATMKYPRCRRRRHVDPCRHRRAGRHLRRLRNGRQRQPHVVRRRHRRHVDRRRHARGDRPGRRHAGRPRRWQSVGIAGAAGDTGASLRAELVTAGLPDVADA